MRCWRYSGKRLRKDVEERKAEGLHAGGRAPPAQKLREAADSGGFVFEYFKNGIKLGDLEQILYPLIQVEQL